MVGDPQLLRQLPPFTISMLGREIALVHIAKDLGVYIDQYLNYNEHINKTVSSCFHKLRQISRIKHLLDTKTLILLIQSFVFSKMFYCSTVWSNTSKGNVHKLQLMQNFGARIVLGLRKYDHISLGLNSFNWLPVKDKLYLNDAVIVFKCINNLVSDYLKNKSILRSQRCNRNTRNAKNHLLHIPYCRLATGQRSFSF